MLNSLSILLLTNVGDFDLRGGDYVGDFDFRYGDAIDFHSMLVV